MARIVGALLLDLPPDEISEAPGKLASYARQLRPWALRTAWRMLSEVDDRSLATWRALSHELSFEVKRSLESAPIGARMRELVQQQVNEIVTIPTRAAERLQELTSSALTTGTRPLALAEVIRTVTETARSNAIRLARTQVSASATALVQARAESVGSVGYLWQTARDADVRPSHRALQGHFVRWDSPPTIDGYTAHAGAFANCRCWADPVLSPE